jgi:hypothetical protein
MESLLGVKNEDSILDEEKLLARTGKMDKLLQDLEEEFKKYSKILDQHIKDI